MHDPHSTPNNSNLLGILSKASLSHHCCTFSSLDPIISLTGIHSRFRKKGKHMTYTADELADARTLLRNMSSSVIRRNRSISVADIDARLDETVAGMHFTGWSRLILAQAAVFEGYQGNFNGPDSLRALARRALETQVEFHLTENGYVLDNRRQHYVKTKP